jgi:hypothetical protein
MKPHSTLTYVYIVSLAAANNGDAASLLTFDDLSPVSAGNSWAVIQNGYGGVQWNNFAVLNGLARPLTEGYRTGTVSPDNVAFNLFGDPASVSSGTGFTLNSAYMTAAFVNGMQLGVQGWMGTTLTYNNTYTLNTNAPVLIDFNYVGVDRVTFITSPGSQYALDNLVITVPEPKALAQLSVAVVLYACGVLRKKIKKAG